MSWWIVSFLGGGQGKLCERDSLLWKSLTIFTYNVILAMKSFLWDTLFVFLVSPFFPYLLCFCSISCASFVQYVCFCSISCALLGKFCYWISKLIDCNSLFHLSALGKDKNIIFKILTSVICGGLMLNLYEVQDWADFFLTPKHTLYFSGYLEYCDNTVRNFYP